MLRSSRTKASRLVAVIGVVWGCELGAPPTGTGPGGNQDLVSGLLHIGGTDVGGPIRFLTPEQRRLFERGSIVFQVEFTPEAGLGPLFNAVGCANCHEVPVVGGGGELEEEPGGIPGEDLEVHASVFENGVCNDLSAQGGAVFQKQATDALRAALGIDHEEPPAGATIANRTTPDVFGFGLLDAVPDAVILSLADPNDRNGDGISGRPNRFLDGRVGRFGRKALIPTLDEFTAGALVLEMGITNPGFPIEESPGGAPIPGGVDPLPEPEIGQADLDAVRGFVRFLAPPRPLAEGFHARMGRGLFHRIGCASCHVPALRTGRQRERALSNRLVFAYTDLLLHDMGPALADICSGDAQPAEFRTEPLMGLRLRRRSCTTVGRRRSRRPCLLMAARPSRPAIGSPGCRRGRGRRCWRFWGASRRTEADRGGRRRTGSHRPPYILASWARTSPQTSRQPSPSGTSSAACSAAAAWPRCTSPTTANTTARWP